MKPMLLCIANKLNTKKLTGFNKVYLNNQDFDYTNIGLGISYKLDNDSLLNNEALINQINTSKNIHIVGFLNDDKDLLKDVLKTCNNINKNIYIHLFSNRKPNIKTLKKEYKIGKIINTIHTDLIINDINRVYNIIFEGKNKNIDIKKEDIVIFYNRDLGYISKFIDLAISKKYEKIITIYPYMNLFSMYKIDHISLSEELESIGIKVLESASISYRLNGYQRKFYKNIKYSYNVFEEKLNRYDLIITDVDKNDIDSLLKFKGEVIVIAKENNKLVLLSKSNINIIDINELRSVIIDWFKNKDNKVGYIFRVISIIFVLFCIVYYVTRLLHFYIME